MNMGSGNGKFAYTYNAYLCLRHALSWSLLHDGDGDGDGADMHGQSKRQSHNFVVSVSLIIFLSSSAKMQP